MKNKDHKSNTKRPDKVKPDNGQGSAGSFGADGDWGSQQDKLKKEERESAPVKIKKAK
jgi:hypothetical protein